MKAKITALAPTTYQLDSLIAFGMEIKKHLDGSFSSSEEFASVEEAKEFLKARAKSYYEDHPCDPEEELQAITVIEKHGILTLDAVTAYIEEIEKEDEQQR